MSPFIAIKRMQTISERYGIARARTDGRFKKEREAWTTGVFALALSKFYARLSENSRYHSHSCCLPPLQERRRLDCIFSELNIHPTYSPVYASSCTSR
jgi:hypothetical protein